MDLSLTNNLKKSYLAAAVPARKCEETSAAITAEIENLAIVKKALDFLAKIIHAEIAVTTGGSYSHTWSYTLIGAKEAWEDLTKLCESEWETDLCNIAELRDGLWAVRNASEMNLEKKCGT